MRYQVSDDVRVIDGVGPRFAESLQAMGIHSIADLLFWKPRNYLDGSNPQLISEISIGSNVALKVRVHSSSAHRLKGGRLPLVRAVVGDESGEILLQWFNQPYISQKLREGEEWIVLGKVSVFQGKKVLVSPRLEKEAVIIPRYPQSKLVNSSFLHKCIKHVLSSVEIHEVLPDEVRLNKSYLTLDDALRKLHAPESIEETREALRTLEVVEAWQFFATLQLSNPDQEVVKGRIIAADAAFLAAVVAKLPFQLTASQKRAVWDIAQEMAQGKVVTRLLNGDVGSGKTVVGALLACLVAKAGLQTLVVSPTEILARQHYESIGKLFQSSGLRVALWTGNKKELSATEEADVVVGTHALLYGGWREGQVGLVVIDEQHRFGVKQRAKLRESHILPPHVLSMTATPIPRSLALVLFAGLDVSFLREKPEGRLAVETMVVTTSGERDTMEAYIADEVSQGRQVFVVCPAILEKNSDEIESSEEGEDLTLFALEGSLQEKKAVESEVKRLGIAFPNARIGMVHGKLPASKKAEVMRAMAAGDIDILVATTVVEVGVDIGNATVLVVENAERFGLAQLHQLRGRVGRGSYQSRCYLVSERSTVLARERLEVLVTSNDGFEIAEADLAFRGPGDLRGYSQAGLPEFKFASLSSLENLIEVRDMLRTYCETHPHYKLQHEVITYSARGPSME